MTDRQLSLLEHMLGIDLTKSPESWGHINRFSPSITDIVHLKELEKGGFVSKGGVYRKEAGGFIHVYHATAKGGKAAGLPTHKLYHIFGKDAAESVKDYKPGTEVDTTAVK